MNNSIQSLGAAHQPERRQRVPVLGLRPGLRREGRSPVERRAAAAAFRLPAGGAASRAAPLQLWGESSVFIYLCSYFKLERISSNFKVISNLFLTFRKPFSEISTIFVAISEEILESGGF